MYRMKLLLSISLLLVTGGMVFSTPREAGNSIITDAIHDVKPRVIAMPDFGADPDDDQSLVRLLVSSNEFQIEGLINVTGCWIKTQTSADAFNSFMEAYEQVYPNLIKHADGYPTVEHLRSVIRLGQQGYGMGDVGEGKDSPGSELIIEVVDRADPRPVWVLLWGGGNTLAQAIWKVNDTRTPEELSAFLSKIRVYDILGQDDTGAWIAKNFPDIFYIRAKGQVYGWQHGRDRDNQWLREHIQPKGPLGAVYPDVKWALEGDTPSFLHIFPNGLNDPEQIEQGGWGGRFSTEKKSAIRGMTESNILDNEGDYDPYYMFTDAPGERNAIRRFKDAIQKDFLGRMIWSITDNYFDANHHPVAVVNGDRTRQIIQMSTAAGTTVTLDARGSFDPDGDALEFSWFYYKEPSSYKGDVVIRNHTSAMATVQVPSDAEGQDIHIVLELRDKGTHQLSAFRRVILNVPAQEISFKIWLCGFLPRQYPGARLIDHRYWLQAYLPNDVIVNWTEWTDTDSTFRAMEDHHLTPGKAMFVEQKGPKKNWANHPAVTHYEGGGYFISGYDPATMRSWDGKGLTVIQFDGDADEVARTMAMAWAKRVR